jgi:fructose-1,6-bisphosphatase/inositol monophosphatase family enzyme
VDAAAWSAVLSETADAVARAVHALGGDRRRALGDRAGQYHLDLVAETAALEVLAPTGARVLSEEAGFVGDGDPTVVMDPVDGSTNFSHGVPHAACSLCVVDGDGPWVALVVNLATGERFEAVRGEGARLDGRPIAGPSRCVELGEALVAVTGWPGGHLGWSQFRAFGAAALDICGVAAGRVDAFVDAGSRLGVWDYLGALLVCTESGVAIGERSDEDLVVLDPGVRRGPIVAATPELREALTGALLAVTRR